MFTLRNAYIALMVVAGLILGVAVVLNPAIAAGPVPPLLILLVVSLIVDVTVMAIAARQGFAPLDTNARVIGFFSAALLYIVLTAMKGISPLG